jgi:hypothetical protein
MIHNRWCDVYTNQLYGNSIFSASARLRNFTVAIAAEAADEDFGLRFQYNIPLSTAIYSLFQKGLVVIGDGLVFLTKQSGDCNLKMPDLLFIQSKLTGYNPFRDNESCQQQENKIFDNPVHINKSTCIMVLSSLTRV